MDATKLGKKVKIDGKNQKTVLEQDEIEKIIQTFNSITTLDGFSVVVNYSDIEKRNLSFSAGQYFEVKIEYSEFTKEEFEKILKIHKQNISSLFEEGHEIEKEIAAVMERLDYDI